MVLNEFLGPNTDSYPYRKEGTRNMSFGYDHGPWHFFIPVLYKSLYTISELTFQMADAFHVLYSSYIAHNFTVVH